MSDQVQTNQKPTKAELLTRIHNSYETLQEILGSLTADQLSSPDSSGWTIKDHLAHIAAWEIGIVELLQHRPRFAAMGVDDALAQENYPDGINARLFELNAGLTLAEAREKFEKTHQQMMQVLESLSEEDLYNPQSTYVPEGTPGHPNPILGFIVGNTYGHYDEHIEYIQKWLTETDE